MVRDRVLRSVTGSRGKGQCLEVSSRARGQGQDLEVSYFFEQLNFTFC